MNAAAQFFIVIGAVGIIGCLLHIVGMIADFLLLGKGGR